MKKLKLIALMIIVSTGIKAQYRDFTIGKANVPNLKIVQIDFRELSTLIHFQFINENSRRICVSENFYIQDKSTHKKYKLLHSINLPFCPNVHVFDKKGQKHNFTLEFEKIPKNIGPFDIIEETKNGENGFCFYNVRIDTTKNTGSYIDVASFIKQTPVKEYGYYYKNGKPIYYYKYKNVVISAMLSANNTYGKYYQVNFLIQNFTGRNRDFNPNLITAEMKKGDKKFDGEVLSYNTYMKKVKHRQAWLAGLVAFSESMAASNAGYSSSYGSGYSSGYSTSSGSASGYVGNTYGSIYGNSSTYSSTYSTSYSRSYNGAAAYAAQQNANRNIANLQNQQYQIRRQIGKGYARLNTIPNKTEYLGYINIKYKKIDHLQVVIPFNNTNYTFYW
jgi:hypothetical protein